MSAATAFFAKALKLSEQGRSAEALEVYDKLLSLFADASDAAFEEMIAAAFFNRGNMLGELGKYDDALLAYEKVRQPF